MRRRRAALGALAGLAALAGIVVGASSGGDGAGTSEGEMTPGDEAAGSTQPPACPLEIASDPARLTGQMVMARMEAQPTDELKGTIRRGERGGVILFPPEGADPSAIRGELEGLARAADRAGAPAPLVATDQEGGEVKRFAAAPPEIAPAEIGSEGGAAAAREQGLATGEWLARRGIGIDLAPVLDVPAVPGAFIASRSFADEASDVAELGVAFATGLGQGGVAATAKHFPGLGRATANTDLGPSVVDASRRELNRGLEPFRAAIAAGVPLVMTANATYPAYDERRPASLSPRITEGLLRDRLGFEGVVITDDLGAGALAAAGIDEAQAAVAAARAGADLLLFALTDGSEAAAALSRAARRGELSRERLLASCARIEALRDRLAAAGT